MLKNQYVLLPGMDGTGYMFRHLIAAMSGEWEYQVIEYPADQDQQYPALANYVIQKLDNSNPIILIAESFSGPIAYQVATRLPEQVKGVFFVATFLRSPRAFLPMLQKLIPFGQLKKYRVPTWLLKKTLLGEEANLELIVDFWRALAALDVQTLRERMNTIAAVQLPSHSLEIPCVYLQATQDILIPSRSVQDFQQRCPQLRIYRVKGKHFLLQSSPAACAEIIITESRSWL